MEKRELERGINRLEILSDLLDNFELIRSNLNIIEFNMDVYGRKDECGTAACAGGLAGLSPRLPGLILRWEFLNDTSDDNIEYGFIVQKKYQFSKNKSFLTCYSELADYFKIDLEESLYLFDPTKYSKCPEKITPKDVLVKLRTILRRKKNQYKKIYGHEYNGSR